MGSKKTEGVGRKGVHPSPAGRTKRGGQTQGQFERDPKRRHGQYSGAGNPPLIKK